MVTETLEQLLGEPLPVDDIDIRTLDQVHASAMARGARCKYYDEDGKERYCPLYGCGRGPVPSEVRSGAPLAVVAEAPGKWEVKQLKPLVGKTGRIAMDALVQGGLGRFEVSLLNSFECQPPPDIDGGYEMYVARLKNEHRTLIEIAEEKGLTPPAPLRLPHELCKPRLDRDLDEAKPNTVLALGKLGLKSVAQHYDIPHGTRKAKKGEVVLMPLKKQLGAPVLPPGKPTIVATYHPAFAMRKGGRHFMPVIQKHITRAAEIALRGGAVKWRDPNPEDVHLDPTVDAVESFCRALVAEVMIGEALGKKREGRAVRPKLTIDIETSGLDTRTCTLFCAGIGGVIDGRLQVMVVPIAHQADSSPWWSESAKERVYAALRALCRVASIRGHNFVTFDSAVLLREGLLTDWTQSFHDTVHFHRATQSSDLPHSLGFAVSERYDAASWKDDANDKYVEEVDDLALHGYCAKDVFRTHVLADDLEREVIQLGTLKQYKTDYDVAPVYRNMTDLGMVISKPIHEKLLAKIGAACVEKRAATIKSHGDPNFNPGSTQQIRKFLFRTKELTPVFSTKGKDWQEGDDPATSIGSLIKLRALGCDEQTREFIDNLIEFRSYDKLRGTYLESLFKLRGKKGKERSYVNIEDWSRQGLGHLWVLHAIFKMLIPTGRVASNPNVQNWPEQGKENMRRLVIPPPGHVIVSADLDQVELRLYASDAEDQALLQAFREGLDPHAWNYAFMIAPNPGNVKEVRRLYDHLTTTLKEKNPKKLKHLRNIAKRFAFLIIYGGEDEKLFQTMSADRDRNTGALRFPGLKPKEVERWSVAWHIGHPETIPWQQHWIHHAERYGYVPGLFERRRYFIGGLNKRNAAPNMRIQSSSGDMINRGAVGIAKRIPHRGWSPFSGLFGQVHDWLGAYVPEARAEEAKRIFREEMPWQDKKGMGYSCSPAIVANFADEPFCPGGCRNPYPDPKVPCDFCGYFAAAA